MKSVERLLKRYEGRALERYERRAMSRRKFAIREFDAFCAGRAEAPEFRDSNSEIGG
jgi:hypothetical protein